jgi:voltage-gated potassium channel
MMNRRFRAPDIRRRFITGFSVFGGLIAAGTAGYMIIEQWSFSDALFMTVTTITTVGYREVRPLDAERRHGILSADEPRGARH